MQQNLLPGLCTNINTEDKIVFQKNHANGKR